MLVKVKKHLCTLPRVNTIIYWYHLFTLFQFLTVPVLKAKIVCAYYIISITYGSATNPSNNPRNSQTNSAGNSFPPAIPPAIHLAIRPAFHPAPGARQVTRNNNLASAKLNCMGAWAPQAFPRTTTFASIDSRWLKSVQSDPWFTNAHKIKESILSILAHLKLPTTAKRDGTPRLLQSSSCQENYNKNFLI